MLVSGDHLLWVKCSLCGLKQNKIKHKTNNKKLGGFITFFKFITMFHGLTIFHVTFLDIPHIHTLL